MSVGAFQRDGFAVIEYPEDLRDAVQKAMASWKLFCALPQAIKDRFEYLEISGTASGVGYERQDKQGPTKDQKELFHVLVEDLARLDAFAQTVSDPDALHFIRNARTLCECAAKPILAIARMLEQELPLPGLEQEVCEAQSGWIFRYLTYPPKKAGESIAAAHLDKSLYTGHLYEDAPGVEFLNWKREWQPMPRVPDNGALIFPSFQLQPISAEAGNEVMGLCHRVVSTEESETAGRHALVCFVTLNRTRYDKGANGRLQDKPEGFNYGMPLAQLQKMFV